jgi:hypothetical protein
VQDAETAEREDRALLCRACGFTVTSSEQAVEVEGSHEHTFFNPAGFIFEIVCFADAPGCLILGEATTYFAWFKGHSWRYAVCDSCHTHLGWSFRSEPGDYFFGLIRNRLVEGT